MLLLSQHDKHITDDTITINNYNGISSAMSVHVGASRLFASSKVGYPFDSCWVQSQG